MSEMAIIAYKKDADDLTLSDPEGNPYIVGSRFRFAILETVEKIEFQLFEDINTNNLTCWEKGRLFGEETEIKWQKRNGKFHVVVTTEEADVPEESLTIYSNELKPIPDQDGKPLYRSIFLWGLKQLQDNGTPKKEWYESRIPQILSYPVNHETQRRRVKIRIQEYRLPEEDGDYSSSFVYRFVTVMEA